MISSPSSCEAASTRSAIWAGRRRASLRYGMRIRAVGTCATKGWTLSQSTIVAGPDPAGERAAGATRRIAPRARGVDADDAPWPSTCGELDLVRADEAGADDVDDVTPGEVATEQELAAAALEAAEVERLALELDLPGSHLEDVVDRHEQLAAADACATSPAIGGCGPPPGRTMRSSTRPILSPLRSSSGLWTSAER